MSIRKPHPGRLVRRTGQVLNLCLGEVIFLTLKRNLHVFFPAWSWTKGTDAHRAAAPASETLPVTYGTGFPLCFFPSDTVNEGIFSFPRTQREKRSLVTRLPPEKWRRVAHSSVPAKTSSSQEALWQAGAQVWPHNKMFSSLYFYPSLVRFSDLNSLLSSAARCMSQRPLTGVHCQLNPLELIVCLCFMAASIDHSASKFLVCVCARARVCMRKHHTIW